MKQRTLNVARWIIAAAKDAETPVTALQLQKLMYYAHGYSLARTGEPLLAEGIQAWQNGPVCKPVYHAFKEYVDRPIDNISVCKSTVEQSLDDRTVNVLQDVWSRYGSWSGRELWESTHTETPWRTSYQEGVQNVPIGDAIIEEYFRTVPEALGADATDREKRFARSMSALRENRKRLDRDERPRGDRGLAEELSDWSGLRAQATAGLLEP